MRVDTWGGSFIFIKLGVLVYCIMEILGAFLQVE